MEMKLETLGEGLVAKRFEKALAQVVANIHDMNTDHKIKRKIVLTMTLMPNESRDQVGVEVQAVTKLAPENAVQTLMAIGGDGKGNLVSAEWQQPSLPMGTEVDQETGELIPLRSLG